jgi:translocation and assembly module TamB
MVTLVEANIDRGDGHAESARVMAVQQEMRAEQAEEHAPDRAGPSAAGDVSLAVQPAAPADSLAGSLQAAGTVRGNVERFDLAGRAVVDDLLYRAARIGFGEAEFALSDVGTESPGIELDAELRDVRGGGAAFDSLSARAHYHGLRGDGAGEAVIVAHGTGDTEYLADAEFELSPERKEVRIADLTLRYDTVTWEMARPGTVSWANDEIQVASIDFRSDAGGSVRLDGRLPVDGSGDLDVVVEELEIAQFMALLQLDRDATGLLNIDADVRGTLEAPRMAGTLRLDEASLDGGAVPDLHASFGYAPGELTLDGTMLHGGRQLAVVEGTLPVDLSLTAVATPRLLPGAIALDVQADSLPLEAIPMLPDQVSDARGRVRGRLAVRGTFSEPRFTGDLDLALGSVRLPPLGLHLQDVAGHVALEGDRVVVDSLVARSEGAVRVSGEIGLESLTAPTFALDIGGRETLVIDTEDAKLRLDADLTVGGTLDALVLEGDVRTRSGVIYIPKLTELGNAEMVSLDTPEGAQRIADEFFQRLRLPDRQAPLLDRLRMDVTLQIDRDVWLRSTEANVEIYTPREVGPLRIVVDGGDTGLALEGTINTDRGEYEFMSRRFELTRGAATFSGDPAINPVLQLAAEHEIRLPGRGAFDMRVLLSGTLRDLEITLESNSQPPISQTDLLAYLAFGSNATSLLYQQGSPLSAQAGDAGELAGNVAGVATQQLGTIALDAVLSDLESELMRDLHVDVFRITPADLPPDMFTGKYVDLLRSTEVEAGRYLSSQLFVAGQVNTGASRPGLRVEYAAPFGLQWETTWRSRWLPRTPTLTDQTPRRAGVLGSFLFREWRF